MERSGENVRGSEGWLLAAGVAGAGVLGWRLLQRARETSLEGQVVAGAPQDRTESRGCGSCGRAGVEAGVTGEGIAKRRDGGTRRATGIGAGASGKGTGA